MKRPTIHDVAAAAGVSRGTVSRLLNGDRYVSPAARAAIERAITETGYVVNRAARSLVTQRTGSVAMVLSEPDQMLFEDPNYSTLIRVAIRRLAERDISLVMMLAQQRGRPRPGGALRARRPRRRRAPGDDPRGRPAGRRPRRRRPPAVSCGAVIGRENVIPYAAADDRLGARQMTEYLVSRGHKRIAMITGPMDTPRRHPAPGGLRRRAGPQGVQEAHRARRLDPGQRRASHGRAAGAHP
ncbi:LacI family DNA-binding transcriptional regulator [Nonomuraea ferruginea]